MGRKLTSIPTVTVPELGYDPADPVLEPLSSPTSKGLQTFQFGMKNLNNKTKQISPQSESLQTCPMRPDTRRQGPHLQTHTSYIQHLEAIKPPPSNINIWIESKEAIKPPPSNEQTTPHADSHHVTRASKISSRALFFIWQSVILRFCFEKNESGQIN